MLGNVAVWVGYSFSSWELCIWSYSKANPDVDVQTGLFPTFMHAIVAPLGHVVSDWAQDSSFFES